MHNRIKYFLFLVSWLFAAGGLAACSNNKVLLTPTDTPLPTAKPTVTQAAQTGPEPGCTVASAGEETDSGLEALFPPVTDDDWSKGPKNASVTIVEYSDFQ